MQPPKKADKISDPALVTKELREWEKHLNEIVGIMCFTLAMASTGTPAPQLWAFLSLIFVIIFQHGASKGKMELLTQLRNNKNRNEYEEFLLNEIIKKLKPSKFPVFIIGFTLLIAIIIIPIFFALLSLDPKPLKIIYGDSQYLFTL